MNFNSNFETYLVVSPKKFIIFVKQKYNFKDIYHQEEVVENNSHEIDLNLFDIFLSKNIFKIEKLLSNFIENIILIIDYKNFFPVQISVKKNNNGDLIDKKNLTHMLKEAKDQCFETFKDKKIIHILIENYQIDKINYVNKPENLKCNFISLDINFICICSHFLESLEKIIKKFQISPNKVMSAEYIKNLFPNEDLDLINMAKKIIDGHNQNEVLLTTKTSKNHAFFEKFFHFFS